MALHKVFYDALPELPAVEPDNADIAWLVYDLIFDVGANRFNLAHHRTVYTGFDPALEKIVTPAPGSLQDFIGVLQQKLDEKMENSSPDAPTLADIVGEQ